MTYNFLQVALGGAIGASARYGVNILAGRIAPGLPLGTLTVNVVGCLAMGLLASALALRGGQLKGQVMDRTRRQAEHRKRLQQDGVFDAA